MDVSTWYGSGTYGIRVGIKNRDKYFDRSWNLIEVNMDGKAQTFVLTAGFWNKCPEFRDSGTPLIKNWLQKHKTLDWPYRQPPRMQLVPVCSNRFELVP